MISPILVEATPQGWKATCRTCPGTPVVAARRNRAGSAEAHGVQHLQMRHGRDGRPAGGA
ncbi:hypothetical protein [Actinomadura sp. RB99]|uniref:hypothetical protein n=1 Tax=Actinomadura sp. RB99 TaxID=2691577 RepID=UPI001683C123|nr:hypothetical protein [Actinomadura sp. RB99]